MTRYGHILNACSKCKQHVWKMYTLCGSNYRTCWKRQHYGDSKQTSGCRGWGRGVGKQGKSTQGFSKQWKYSAWRCDVIQIQTHESNVYTYKYKNETLVKTINLTAQRVNLNTCKLLKMKCKNSFRSLGESQDGLQKVTSVCLYYKR